MAGRLGVNHLVRDVVGKMLLQLGVALEKWQVALVGDTVKIVDFGNEAIPVLPKYFDRFHRQAAIRHVVVKSTLDEPAIGNLGQIFFQIGDDRVGFLWRDSLTGKILSSKSHIFSSRRRSSWARQRLFVTLDAAQQRLIDRTGV